MKKRNKKYSPKRIVTNTLACFFGGMSDQHSAHLQETLLALHCCMSKLARGVGDENDWNNCNQAISMGLIFAGQGIGNEHLDELRAGRDAMASCVMRYHKAGKFLFTGDELKAVNAALDVHDAQMTCVRGVDVDRAARELNRRLKHNDDVSSAFDPNLVNAISA